MNLSKNVKVSVLAAAAAAGTTAVNGSIIDMNGFDGVLFIALIDSAIDGSVQTLKAQQNTINSTTGIADITGATTVAQTAASQSTQKALVLDVFRPQQQFLRPVLTRTAQNAVVDGIVAIQYSAGKKPTVQDATVLASAVSVPTA